MSQQRGERPDNGGSQAAHGAAELGNPRGAAELGNPRGPARIPGGAARLGAPGVPETSDFPDLPEATVARLPEYLRALHNLADVGHDTVSSEGLAAAAGVNSAKLRKDLSYLGSNGTRGVGYDVTLLTEKIEYVLGLNQHRAVALVGVGNLGHALAGYTGFGTRGFHFAALFDADPGRVGEQINGLVVRHIDELAEVVAEEHIAIALIATPAHAAQAVADALVSCGVTSILNFAPCVLSVPDNVDVRKVDLAIELQILSFHEHRKSSLTALPSDLGQGAVGS
jgi:redox-sensing transcriptional repressor